MKKIIPFLLFLFLIELNGLKAAIIKKIPRLQLAGVITLKAESAKPDSVKWFVNLITVDELTGEKNQTSDLQEATGYSLRLLLIKYPGKYTFYKIIADDGLSPDSITLQVFNKGVAQKYLFANPDYPQKPIVVFLVLPASLSANSNFVMVMHGTNRNAMDYANAWRQFVNKHDYIIAAPEFSKADWPHSRSYNLGNIFTGSDGSGNLNPESKWAFNAVVKLHDELVKGFGLKKKTYDIWGHSAGAQFVHRLMEFLPDENVRYYIAANAGWYTLPDLTVEFPYGLKHHLLNFTSNDLIRMNAEQMIVMRGTADTLQGSNLRTTPEAMAQGKNRYERAETFFNTGFNISDADKWQLIDVPNVGHDYIKMAEAAQNFLLANPIDGVKENRVNLLSFKLMQNYPNPFNPSTNIEYYLNKAGFVQLEIFDLLGRKIETLVNRNQSAGKYFVCFNANNSNPNFSSGIYFYVLKFNGLVLDSKKMIFLK